MARVFFSAALQRSTGGVEEWEVPASSMRELAARLDEQFPGLAGNLKSAAVSIDGDVVPGAWLEHLEPDSEIHFLPALSGG